VTFKWNSQSAPEKGEELPLEELGSALGVGHSGALGKYVSGLISRMVGGKIPSGFNISSIKTRLSKIWGLGPSRSDGVLLLDVLKEHGLWVVPFFYVFSRDCLAWASLNGPELFLDVVSPVEARINSPQRAGQFETSSTSSHGNLPSSVPLARG
jgi:Fatty acid synthase subunit alpha Acyl carrier domain